MRRGNKRELTTLGNAVSRRVDGDHNHHGGLRWGEGERGRERERKGSDKKKRWTKREREREKREIEKKREKTERKKGSEEERGGVKRHRDRDRRTRARTREIRKERATKHTPATSERGEKEGGAGRRGRGEREGRTKRLHTQQG